MFHEYALDPACISSWERARYFLDAFGPDKGRFLAEYPRQWRKRVIQELRCAPMEKHKIVERLRKLERRVFSGRKDAPYRGEQPWLENAEAEHRRHPFQAIIANHKPPSGSEHILDADDVDDTHPRWRTHSGTLVARDGAAMAAAVGLLIAASTEILIIDPYFRADQNDKTAMLVQLCRRLSDKANVRIHYSDEPRGYQACSAAAARALPNVLPPGLQVTLHCWKERAGGRRLHNRYLLTEVAGVKFGDGVEIGNPGQVDHLSILDEPSRLALFDEFEGSVPAYDRIGEPLSVVGGSRPTSRRPS